MCVPSVGAARGNTDKAPKCCIPDFFIFPRRDAERCQLLDPLVSSEDLTQPGDITYPRKTGEGDVDLLKRCRYRSLPIKKVELLLDTENLPQESLAQPKEAECPVRSLVFALCDEDFVWRRQLFNEVEMWMRDHNDWHGESSVSIQSVVDYLLQQQPSAQEGDEDADEDVKALLRHNLHKNLRKFIRREEKPQKRKTGSAVFARLQYRRKRRGTGAFGTVFDGDVEVRIRGLPPLLRNLAVKEVFNAEKEPSWTYLRKMIREHRGMTRVRYHVAPQSCERHHLMQPIASFLGLTGAWLLVEAVPGADLGSVLTVGTDASGHQEKCLNLVQIRSCMRDIVEALAKLEEKRLCHLDVKPENVMVYFPRKNTNDIICKLIDFGFVVDLNYEGPWMGTRKYSPPECWRDSDTQGSAYPVMDTGRGYDSWSAGVLMFELLTGDWQTAVRIWRSRDVQGFAAELRSRLNLEDWVQESIQMLGRSAIPSSLRGAAGRIRPIFQGAFALIQRLLWADPDERLTPKQAKYFQVNFLYDDALYDALSESERAIVPAEVAEHCQVRRYLERFWGNVIRRHQRNLLGEKSSEINPCHKAKVAEQADSTTSEEMPFVSDLEVSSDNESVKSEGSHR